MKENEQLNEIESKNETINKESNIKQKKKENKLGLIILCLSILICIVSVSYAIWTQFIQGKNINKITTAKLDIVFEDENNPINLQNAIPISDDQGQQTIPYVFNLENRGTVPAGYRLYLIEDEDSYREDDCLDKKMNLSDIKVSFAEVNQYVENASFNTDLLSSSGGKLFEGTIGANQIKTFALKLWIKSDATAGTKDDPNSGVMGKHFHGKVKVEAIQSDQSFND